MRYSFLFVILLVGLSSCASRGPRSEARIIAEGDENPFISDNPEHAGERTRTIEAR